MNSITVLGLKIKIKYEIDPEIEGTIVDGYFSAQENLIVINKNQSKDQQHLTLLHEIGHGLLYRTGTHSILSAEVEELIVEQFSQMMHDLLRFK